MSSKISRRDFFKAQAGLVMAGTGASVLVKSAEDYILNSSSNSDDGLYFMKRYNMSSQSDALELQKALLTSYWAHFLGGGVLSSSFSAANIIGKGITRIDSWCHDYVVEALQKNDPSYYHENTIKYEGTTIRDSLLNVALVTLFSYGASPLYADFVSDPKKLEKKYKIGDKEAELLANDIKYWSRNGIVLGMFWASIFTETVIHSFGPKNNSIEPV